MEVKYRQRGFFGCGSFTLANIFDDHRFVEDLPIGHGERLPDLQRKMNKFQKKLFIDCLFMTNETFKTGNRLTYTQRHLFRMAHENQMTREQNETLTVPYIVGFSRANGSTHNIAVFHNLKNNMYHIVDSCLQQVEIMTLRELITQYRIVAVSIFRFRNNPEQCNFMVAPKEDFSNIFTPED